MPLSPSRMSSRGTTLIEAMAALVVFSVGILGVMQMNVLASQQNNLARSQTTASRIARDVADSFERLPFTHDALKATTTLLQDDPEFANISNLDGLVTLQAAMAMPGRPLLGAADAIFAAEGESTFYQVAWRTVDVPNPERSNTVDQKRILVMVRFPAPGGGMKQVNVWAVKTSPQIITGDDSTTLEF